MRVEKRLQVLIVVAAMFCFVPLLFFMQDIWDGKHIGYALRTGNTGPLWDMFIPTRWTLYYYVCLGLGAIQDTLGVSYKVVTNILSCLSLAGISLEIARILDKELGLEREYRLLAVLAFLVLPPWATLMSSMLFFHITCVWAFLLAVRWRRSAPLPAVVLFACSLALNSIFAFAVGFALFFGLLAVDRDNWLRVGLRVFFFSAGLLAVFVLYRHFYPPFAGAEEYNSFNLRVSALYNYAGLFAGLMGAAWLLTGGEGRDRRGHELRVVAACWVLLFFAGFAYTYVGKPIKLEGTNSFTPRQAFLATVPTAMLVAVMVRLGVQRMGRRIAYGLAGVVLLVSFLYQFTAFQQKFTQLYFENAVARIFRTVEPPEPGVVIFEAERDQVPKYLRDFPAAADFILYEAYGRKHWFTWVGEPGDRVDEARIQGWKKALVRMTGLPEDDLHLTRVRLDLGGFDPFGSPMVYYYYLTDAFDRLGFKMTYEEVGKLD